MGSITDYLFIIFMYIFVIGLLMKAAAYIGERIGFYRMIQVFVRLFRKNQ
ncbi:hypothetical protein JSY36_05120 [Bacillus sp. H-16]|nr:hypothetical protein [Alteribacter salitolerans]MBM7095134.1 hypothetical protein [Alteribacter salitolerans]